MRPEILVPLLLHCCVCVEVLQLRESKEGRSDEDVDSKDLDQALVVEEERILKGELSIPVRVHNACILHNIDVLWWPPSRYV